MPNLLLRACIQCSRAIRRRLAGWWLLLLALGALVVPEPAVAQAPQSDTAKWLTANDAKWQATYQRDVAGPFAQGVAELRRQYLASLAGPTQAAAGDGAAIWTAEREHVSGGENVPPTDAAGVPAPLKSLRRNYREQFARLDKQRFDRARALFAQCDAVLSKNQAALLERNRANEAADVQKERDQLRTAWLQPPAAAAATPPLSPGSAAAPARLTPQQILERLLALGAGVSVKLVKGDIVEVKLIAQVSGEKFTFARVELRAQRPDETPLVAADYAILESLAELPELSLSGENVTGAVLEKLRPFRALQILTLDGAKIPAASYNLFPALPELRELWLGNTGTNDEALKTIVQCRKLKSLHLVTQPISNDGLGYLGKMPALEVLDLNDLDKLDSAGFAHLADCRDLKQITAAGFTILSSMVENLAHCKNLEVVALPGSVLKDADIAPLSVLTKLRSLDLDGSSVTGTAFASWPMRSALTGLNLHEAGGVDDAVLKSLEHAFPKVEELDFKVAATGFSTAGAATLGKLRSLHTLRLGGAGVTDEVVAQLIHCDGLTTLAIPAAQLTDPGVAALAKLPHLAELSLDQPPLSEAALKSFGHCKELKVVNIGKGAVAETEDKLQRAVPGLTVHRAVE